MARVVAAKAAVGREEEREEGEWEVSKEVTTAGAVAVEGKGKA